MYVFWEVFGSSLSSYQLWLDFVEQGAAFPGGFVGTKVPVHHPHAVQDTGDIPELTSSGTNSHQSSLELSVDCCHTTICTVSQVVLHGFVAVVTVVRLLIL